MATTSNRETLSPPAPSPQVSRSQSSRRGSVSSLSSIGVLGKETVALALDQIHSTASQSEALTTFNQYTSPPQSSSGTDNKGLTGDIQGGISGLYNRLRASVGSTREPNAQECSPEKAASNESGITNEGPTSLDFPANDSERVENPVISTDNRTKEVSQIKRAGENEGVGAHAPTPKSSSKSSEPTIEALPTQANHRDMRNLDKEPRRTDWESTELVSSGAMRPNDDCGVSNENSSNAMLQSKEILKDIGSTRSDLPKEAITSRMHSPQSSSVILPSEAEAKTLPTKGAVEAVLDPGIEKFTGYQHLEIPLRKSLAPPVVSRSNSPRPSLSRASSSGSNADSLLSLPTQAPSGRHYSKPRNSVAKSPLGFQPAGSRESRTASVFSQAKSKVLSKEYWMKDENAKDCFGCGDAFSAFRRKHHCRTCGQIFDAKCTSVVSGEYFSLSGSLRVCKPCEGIIKGEDDSSDVTDEGTLSLPSFRPRHGSAGASDTLASPFIDPNFTGEQGRVQAGNSDVGAPTMSIPATRKAGEKAGRKPAVVEIGPERGLIRPSSSRSLKSAFGSRSHMPGHRRHNSRSQFPRNFRPNLDDHAPFHQDTREEKTQRRLATFHADNIIDPDLAPYLSDDESSGDEQVSIMAALNGGEMSGSLEDKAPWDASSASARRSRFRSGERSLGSVAFANREADAQSLNGSRSSRPGKRRTFSTSSTAHLRPSPRSYRASAMNFSSSSSLRDIAQANVMVQANSPPTPGNLGRMLRSSSMKGAAAPLIEINDASLQHVQKLLLQLLTDNGVSDVVQWQKSLLPILLRATDDVNPDVQNGDDMDIRHYIKLKKIPGGAPGDTAYVSGVVFTKNLALKTMPRSIFHPNILIITFPLEYARHQQHFMSLEPVIRQEKEFLHNLVSRISALRPHLLLVERHVSGLALEYLQQANIATAYNVKPSVLEAVSRCCQTRIITSIDKLAIRPAQAGKCASFYLKTFLNGRRKKTYMFLSGSAKELGCTIVLRGADATTLRKIKSITEFMVYVVYSLKLETCLMKDEYALLPSNVDLGSLSAGPKHIFDSDSKDTESHTLPSDRALPDVTGRLDDEESSNKPTTPMQSAAMKSTLTLPDEDSVPDDVPMPTFYTNMVNEHKTKILSASPFVKFMQPYLLMRAREQERRLDYLKRLRDEDLVEMQSNDTKPKNEKFELIKPEMVHKRIPNAPKKVREVLYAVHDAEYDKALYNYQTQSRQWETYIAGNLGMFDPFSHQNIAVLYSVVCTATTVPCSGPDLVSLAFYNEQELDAAFEADCTLGQYVEDLCIGASTVCTANGCEKQMIEHHRQYVHGEAQVSVFTERYPCKLPDSVDTILMWGICRKCGKETEVRHMSENTWKYSFGKYLELSFWSSSLQPQAEMCPHDIHRDFLRYFGFKDMAVRVHYDPITLLEIIVPRARITWKVDNDLRFRNEVFIRIEERLTKFMASVKARIQSISAESVLPEKVQDCKLEVERLRKKATVDHSELLTTLRERYMSSKHYEVLPLNQVIRTLQEKVVEWDNCFSDFDRNFFPSEKDIRRLAALQLKKIFLERDESASTFSSDISDQNSEKIPEKDRSQTTSGNTTPPKTLDPSTERTHDALTAVAEDASSVQSHPGVATDQKKPGSSEVDKVETVTPSPIQDVQHLDLAVDPEVLSQTQMAGPKMAILQEHEEYVASQTRPSPAQNQSKVHEVGTATHKIDPKSSKQRLEKKSQMQTTQQPPAVQQPSNIPRPGAIGPASRAALTSKFSRTHSQPVEVHQLQPSQPIERNGNPEKPAQLSQAPAQTEDSKSLRSPPGAKAGEKHVSDGSVLSGLIPSKFSGHSMIPLSVAARKRDSRVSHLARHFEQLSREFEKERLKERKQRAVLNRRSRAHPLRPSKPIVQIYKNVTEAVDEKGPLDEDTFTSDPSTVDTEVSRELNLAHGHKTSPESTSLHIDETTADNTEAEDFVFDETTATSDIEGEALRSDDEQYLTQGIDLSTRKSEHPMLVPDGLQAATGGAQLDLKLDLPKHEKTSLMKMLTNFWAERSASGWQPLDYPLRATDHIFADSDIIVREDEPSSLISFALGSEDYQQKLTSILKRAPSTPAKTKPKTDDESHRLPTEQVQIEDSLLRPTGTHLKYQFSEGSAKMLCKVFYAEQFDAVRRKCGVEERMTESLSRCMKWDSKGGKTNSLFLKTLDDRFVLKSLSPVETQAFLRFAPAYFRIISESLFHELPSVIAKMLGFYQIIIKNPSTGVDFNWFLLVMENLFYDRSPNRIFDLKGSMRNRRIQSTGEQNEVLLDENMVEFIYESPLFAREHSTKLLRASVWNDTLFLSRQNVMDYSLMIAIDETKKELVVGIIDCIRTYTWDKKLESWIKDRGKNRPTVTSPKEYKSRFREAMGRYVLQAPNCWHQFKAHHIESKPLPQAQDDPGDDKEARVLDLA